MTTKEKVLEERTKTKLQQGDKKIFDDVMIGVWNEYGKLEPNEICRRAIRLVRQSCEKEIEYWKERFEGLQMADDDYKGADIHYAVENERSNIAKEVEAYQNPYPKDIFVWDNKEKLDFNRGRFNRHCFEIVENVRKDVLAIVRKQAKEGEL